MQTLDDDADDGQQRRQRMTMQTMDEDAYNNAATQTMVNDSDNDDALQRRQQGDMTTRHDADDGQ
jgi:hypothetical protein